MSQQQTLIQRLRTVRQRALLIAEYLLFTKIQQSQNTIAATSHDDWEQRVKEIELHIMVNEEPTLIPFHTEIDDYQPLGVFFNEVHTNIEHVEVYVPPQN